MGVHFGVVAARTSWDRLLTELAQIGGDFVDRGPVATIDEVDPRSADEGFVVVGGEHQGAAFLLDSSMTLWSAGLDRFVEASRRLQCTLGLALGETVSGTFGLLAAEQGVVRRVYYNCVSSIRQPFGIGEPLATEAHTALEEIDGHGLWRALLSCGLDFEGWYAEGSKRAYVYKPTDLIGHGQKDRGQIELEIERHCEHNRIPPDQAMGTTVVRRRMPDGSTAWDIVPAPPRMPLVARILGLFSRKA